MISWIASSERYGRANRIWVMDRGIPTEESLAKMRGMGASYLVGTPKGRLSRLEQANLVKVEIQKDSATTASLKFRLLRDKLRQVRRREGRYLLRTNLAAH